MLKHSVLSALSFPTKVCEPWQTIWGGSSPWTHVKFDRNLPLRWNVYSKSFRFFQFKGNAFSTNICHCLLDLKTPHERRGNGMGCSVLADCDCNYEHAHWLASGHTLDSQHGWSGGYKRISWLTGWQGQLSQFTSMCVSTQNKVSFCDTAVSLLSLACYGQEVFKPITTSRRAERKIQQQRE